MNLKNFGHYFLFILVFLCSSSVNAQETSFDDPSYWRQALGGAVIGRPVAQEESVAAATDGGNLRSFSTQGKLLWDYYARGRLSPHISRSREGTSYICRTNGILIAVNRSGRELWQHNLQAPIVSPVLIGWDSRLFIFTSEKITCMTAAGYILWSRTLEKRIALAPIRDSSGGVIFALENGELQRFDPFGNVFSYSLPRTPAAIASLEIPEYGFSILALYENNQMDLIPALKGFQEPVVGRLALPSPPLAVIGRKEEAAVLLKDGMVALVSPEKSEILWTASGHISSGELSGQDAFELLFDERGIYVTTKTGATGFTPDGRRLWTIQLRGATAIPAFGDDGILYSGGSDWILYAYRLEDRVRDKQRFLYGEASEGNYGTGNPGPSSWADYYFRFYEAELEERFMEIRGAIMAGAVGASEKEYAAWLMETAGALTVNIRHRMEAARLLGYIGSRETIPFLANLFSRDSEALVKAAAAAAIGKIGVDPEGFAIRAFENAILSPFRLLDEAALTAVAAATGALCRFSGPPLSVAGVRILTVLSGYDNLPSARNQARRELQSL